ncbi:Na+/H+ antiporter subunit E [Janibacter sp. YIM B02568]|jgi:multicomponent Na+:H+ antiporter subunit E|uniref:Na+/H+ antiporter subunit E n=1 Tax=Janibacter endophyticus TaxID=2806261 RepID=UPI001952958E|nr:Na+/H+ antiporter subunit E [Janibacter endophyticus]MBM6547227.1 Na+/H+ antiporter subunit E [Janibacter endophyticus]
MRLWQWLSYLAFIAVELHRGAFQLAVDIATPGSSRAPALVELPLRCRTDLEISALASSITITPGTLVVGTAAARGDTPPTLFVHCLYGRDIDEVVEGLRDMESRLLRATRGAKGVPA